MLTAVPHYAQYAGDVTGATPPALSARPHAELEKLAEEIGLPYLNSFEMLAPKVQGTPQTTYYYRNDMHFNPRGYALWASAHGDFLLDPANGLLPPALYGRNGIEF